jgi:hypothetical protein
MITSSPKFDCVYEKTFTFIRFSFALDLFGICWLQSKDENGIPGDERVCNPDTISSESDFHCHEYPPGDKSRNAGT